RRSAAIALGNLGDTRAVLPLTDILADSSTYVRNAASRALDKIQVAEWKREDTAGHRDNGTVESPPAVWGFRSGIQKYAQRPQK
ncbi:MAG: HEAT repeat domain-containing protein, partial [Candidatus Poribacteria bacterium]|nr:HEAT repeat domain-containing protein [Candidatus Poribacteria bacterium]